MYPVGPKRPIRAYVESLQDAGHSSAVWGSPRAKATWALEFGQDTNDVPAWSDIIGETNYLSRLPTCPSRGTYTLRSVGEPPVYSVPGHVLPSGRR